jgi:hypothetical protein
MRLNTLLLSASAYGDEPRYVPKTLPIEELFSADRKADAGKHFEEMFGDGSSVKVTVSGEKSNYAMLK